MRLTILLALATGLAGAPATAQTSWAGLVIADEYRCAPYDRDDYPYSAGLEAAIIAAQTGRVYGPWSGRLFESIRQTDIEHIVSLSEAHDSGLCAAGPALRRQFAGDLLNLTLAGPDINRCGRGGKCGYDAAEWLPPRNRCWFAARVIQVRRKYRLTIDLAEARVLGTVLSGCASTAMTGP